MLENLDDILSFALIIACVVGGIFGFIRLNKNVHKDEADDYFRDLF